MRYHSLVTSMALSVAMLGLTACENLPSDTSAELDTDTPTITTASAEANMQAGSGAMVGRFPSGSFLLIYDAETELLAAHMPSNICAGGGANIVEVQRVDLPSDVVESVSLVKSDDAQVAIYDAGSPAEAGLAAGIDFFGQQNIVDVVQFCGFLLGPDRIAEGSVRRVSTLSPASFHARWTGTIEGVDGRDYKLTEVYQLNADVHDPNNPDTFKQVVASIKLRPSG